MSENAFPVGRFVRGRLAQTHRFAGRTIAQLAFAAAIAVVGARADLAIAQTAPDQMIGAWKLETKVDQMTDRKSASITVDSAEGEFAFQCDAPGHGFIYPIFVSRTYMGGSGGGYGSRQIMLRFDADAVLSPIWVYNTYIAFVPHDHKQALELMDRTSAAKKLAIRATTFEGQFVDTAFDLNGASDAILRLKSLCDD